MPLASPFMITQLQLIHRYINMYHQTQHRTVFEQRNKSSSRVKITSQKCIVYVYYVLKYILGT